MTARPSNRWNCSPPRSGEEIVGQLYKLCGQGVNAPFRCGPKMTPTLARMVARARAQLLRNPSSGFALPQLFRYERQQKGRLREHFQFKRRHHWRKTDPAADAELIALLIDTPAFPFGLTSEDFVIRLSSRNAWHDFYEKTDAKRVDGEGNIVAGLKEYEFFQIIDKLEAHRAPEESENKIINTRVFRSRIVNQFIESGKPTVELDKHFGKISPRVGLRDFAKIDYRVIRGPGPITPALYLKRSIARANSARSPAAGGVTTNLVKLLSGGQSKACRRSVRQWAMWCCSKLLKRAEAAAAGFRRKTWDVYVLIEDESPASACR